MNGNVTTYDAKDTVVTVNDTYISGLGEDMIEGEQDEDQVSPVVGAQGDIIVNVVNNSLGTVKLSVQPTSPQYRYLLEIAAAKRMVPIWCVNKALGEKFGGSKSHILKSPAAKNSAEAEDREFEFKVYDYVHTGI